MKKFLLAIREHCATLMAKIAKNEVIIASAGGMQISSNPKALSFEDAHRVQKNYLEYKKESGRFIADQTKIVVPKIVLFNILNKGLTNLYLFQPPDYTGGIRSELTHEADLAREEIPSFWKALFLLIGSMGLLIMLLVSVFAEKPWPDFSDEYSSNRALNIFISSFFTALLFVFYCDYSFKKRYTILKNRKKLLDNPDFELFFTSVSRGYNEGWSEDWSPNIQLKLVQIINYAEMLSQAVSFGGSVGYLILKNKPFAEKKVCQGVIHLTYDQPYIPVIFLQHSVIFDIRLIDSFSEKDIERDIPINEIVEAIAKSDSLHNFL